MRGTTYSVRNTAIARGRNSESYCNTLFLVEGVPVIAVKAMCPQGGSYLYNKFHARKTVIDSYLNVCVLSPQVTCRRVKILAIINFCPTREKIFAIINYKVQIIAKKENQCLKKNPKDSHLYNYFQLKI